MEGEKLGIRLVRRRRPIAGAEKTERCQPGKRNIYFGLIKRALFFISVFKKNFIKIKTLKVGVIEDCFKLENEEKPNLI